jgi:hypothetical protein
MGCCEYGDEIWGSVNHEENLDQIMITDFFVRLVQTKFLSILNPVSILMVHIFIYLNNFDPILVAVIFLPPQKFAR